MIVLSLFDGISCGQVALERIGIVPEKYLSSEIDKYAIQITQKNFPDTIQLGDIKEIDTSTLPPIDILIGGSPCQGFSFAGTELNFNDSRSKLFFEFVRILKETCPKYFLMENVNMRKEYQDIISDCLGVSPVEINSSLVSAQNRKRLYWTNIPLTYLEDRKIFLKDVLEEHGLGGRRVGRRLRKGKRVDADKSVPCIQRTEINADSRKSNCLTTVAKDTVIVNGTEWRYLTPLECERLQTLPEEYTAGVSKSQRLKMIGNAWTVDIISHIMKGILNE